MCLKIYEVSLKYLLRLSENRVDTILRMDRQMDGWMDRRRQGKNNMSLDLSRGHNLDSELRPEVKDTFTVKLY